MDIFKRREPKQTEYIQHLINVQIAREQWQNSIKYFESVCEDDLVEYAIYEMEASKRQYICMLTRLREMYFELKNNREVYSMQELEDNTDMHIELNILEEVVNSSQKKA